MYEMRACRYPSICSFFINLLYRGDERITTKNKNYEPAQQRYEENAMVIENRRLKIQLEAAHKQLNSVAKVIVAIPWGFSIRFDPTNLAASLEARLDVAQKYVDVYNAGEAWMNNYEANKGPELYDKYKEAKDRIKESRPWMTQ